MKIKFCGIKSINDISYCNILKPDYVGFVLAKGSKRYVDLNSLKNLSQNLDKSIIRVGVFLNNSIEEIKESLDYIDIIQLHKYKYDEIDIIRSFKKPIIQAISIDELPYNTDYVLYDNKTPGSGKSFDWSLLKGNNYFLAGGIGINNIDEVIKINPYCVDISSGIEDEFGNKNFLMMKKIIEKVR